MLLDDKNKTNRNTTFFLSLYIIRYNCLLHIISTLLNKICQILKIGPRKLHLRSTKPLRCNRVFQRKFVTLPSTEKVALNTRELTGVEVQNDLKIQNLISLKYPGRRNIFHILRH